MQECIQYQVRTVSRYIVTRYAYKSEGNCTEPPPGVSSTKGEYNNADVAFEVAYALCKAEHEALGYPPDDMRVMYPGHPLADVPADQGQCSAATPQIGG